MVLPITPHVADITALLEETGQYPNIDLLILHAATNDVARESADKVIEKLRILETELQTQNSKSIAISSVCCRKNVNTHRRVRLVNAAIKLICNRNNWHYIDNSNIGIDSIGADGIHPNEQGIELLHQNFQKSILDIRSSCFPLTQKTNTL